MTLDKLVTSDLAALATNSQRQPISVDDLLPAETEAEPLANRALLALGRIYAHRVARVVAGSVMIVMTFAVIAALMVQSFRRGEFSWLPNRLYVFDVGTRTMGAVLLAVALASYVVALQIADRVFDHRTAGSLDRARRLTRATDGWAVALGIAGVVAFVTMIGSFHFLLGREPWLLLMVEQREWRDGPEIGPIVDHCKWSILVFTTIALALALTLGRACARRVSWLQALEHPSVLVLGLVLGLVTLYLGFTLESLPITEYDDVSQHSESLRQALTIGGVTAVFVVMTSLTLRRRRREIERGGL